MAEDFTSYQSYRPQRPSARRKDRASSVGRLVGARLDQMGIGDKVRQHTAPLVWAELVGPQVAGATEPERVREGVLYVAARSAVWAHELNYHKADILRRLNDRIGAQAGKPLIIDIRFFNKGVITKQPAPDVRPPLSPTRAELEDIEVTPQERAAIDQDVSGIADETLRERLRRARLADVRTRRWRTEHGWQKCPDCGEPAPPRFPDDGMVNCSRCRVARFTNERNR